MLATVISALVNSRTLTLLNMWSDMCLVQYQKVRLVQLPEIPFHHSQHSSGLCIKAAAEARAVLGMVKRNFRKLDESDFLILYKTYIIRPHMQYCVQAWSPHLQRHPDSGKGPASSYKDSSSENVQL